MGGCTLYYYQRTKEFEDLSLIKSLEFLKKVITCYTQEIKTLVNYNYTITNISEFNLDKVNSLACVLSVNYNAYLDNVLEGKEAVEKGLLLQSWISLGAVLEGALQMFLKIHNYSYQNAPVIRKIKKGNIEVRIEKINLFELIEYFFDENNGIIKSNTYDKDNIDLIRTSRNLVHFFTDDELLSWEEFNKSIKLIIEVILDLLNRLPEVQDENGFVEGSDPELSRYIRLQKQEWFNLKY